jgi:hypothetical protein
VRRRRYVNRNRFPKPRLNLDANTLKRASEIFRDITGEKVELGIVENKVVILADKEDHE